MFWLVHPEPVFWLVHICQCQHIFHGRLLCSHMNSDLWQLAIWRHTVIHIHVHTVYLQYTTIYNSHYTHTHTHTHSLPPSLSLTSISRHSGLPALVPQTRVRSGLPGYWWYTRMWLVQVKSTFPSCRKYVYMYVHCIFTFAVYYTACTCTCIYIFIYVHIQYRSDARFAFLCKRVCLLV